MMERWNIGRGKYLFHSSFISLFIFPFSEQCFSQNKEKEIIAVNAGAGILTFHGNVGGSSLVGAFGYIRGGRSFYAEKYFGKNFALSFGGMRGKIAREDGAGMLPRRNFESFISEADLNATLLLAGRRNYPLIPFLSLGISYLSFDPHTDMTDRNGKIYYYWKDGSVRDLPETDYNIFYAKPLERDYNYESEIDSGEFKKHALVFPLTAGIKIKLTPRMDANLGFSWHFAATNHLDGVKTGGRNDNYLYSSVSLTWHIFTLSKDEQEKISSIDFSSLDKTDSDGDGVPDTDDLCAGTPKDVKVDGKGCPIDSDADGVPDYLDKEPHSKNGLPVDANGVELTKERLAQLQKGQNAPAELHSRAHLSEEFNKKPSAAFMQAVEEMELEKRKNPDANKTTANPIPYDLRIADWNKDGFIASDEIAKTIDAFFDGTITFSAEQIHRLIDFFFEQ